MPKLRRTTTKLIRYTPDELQLVVDRARDCGRPVACYIRETSLGATPRAQRAQRSAEVIRHLTRLGNRLVALAQAARERQLPTATEFDAQLAALLDVLRQIE